MHRPFMHLSMRLSVASVRTYDAVRSHAMHRHPECSRASALMRSHSCGFLYVNACRGVLAPLLQLRRLWAG
jgi:hypothetical protein